MCVCVCAAKFSEFYFFLIKYITDLRVKKNVFKVFTFRFLVCFFFCFVFCFVFF